MTRFKTKHQAANTRKHSWSCTKCGSIYAVKPAKNCDMCGADKIHYFASMAELRRFQTLRLFAKLGKIEKLELQPVFEIWGKKSGIKLMEYRADFRYVDCETGQTIVEDVKGSVSEKHLDPVFKIKRRSVESEYQIKISLVK